MSIHVKERLIQVYEKIIAKNVSTLARVIISKDIKVRGPIKEIQNNRESKTTWVELTGLVFSYSLDLFVTICCYQFDSFE